MLNYRINTYLKIILFISLISLVSAYFIEYILGYQPCNLCVIERLPYAISIIVLLFNYFFKKNQIFYSILLILIFLFSILISIYHFSIEQGFIEESIVCTSKNLDLIVKEDIINSLQELRVSCKDVAFKIFGLSLTTYNILISILMFLLSTKIYLLTNDIKK